MSEDATQVDKPVPREPKSPRHASQIQAQNRRREYLERHPSYYTDLEHEFADPILYERLIKRFQTIEEREADGKAKGYGRTLEADLLRGEAKLSNLRESNGSSHSSTANGTTARSFESSWESATSNREHGLEMWHAFLKERFIQGNDTEFDYTPVDTDEDLDSVARREAEDAWFDEEEPSWVDEQDASAPKGTKGETGIQDF